MSFPQAPHKIIMLRKKYTKCSVERCISTAFAINTKLLAGSKHSSCNNHDLLRFRGLERESDCGPDVATEVVWSTVVRPGSVCHNRRGSLRRHESVSADGQEIQAGKPVKISHGTEMGHVQSSVHFYSTFRKKTLCLFRRQSQSDLELRSFLL